jgi:transposase
MARFDLSDAEWTIIAPLLPGAEGKKNGRPRPDDRKVLNGIFFVLRTGTPWRDLLRERVEDPWFAMDESSSLMAEAAWTTLEETFAGFGQRTGDLLPLRRPQFPM